MFREKTKERKPSLSVRLAFFHIPVSMVCDRRDGKSPSSQGGDISGIRFWGEQIQISIGRLLEGYPRFGALLYHIPKYLSIPIFTRKRKNLKRYFDFAFMHPILQVIFLCSNDDGTCPG